MVIIITKTKFIMNIKYFKLKHIVLSLALGVSIAGCQKMDRPELGVYPEDPPPPPYDPLKSFMNFDGNATDAGESQITPAETGVTYVTGVKGQAAQFGDGGYILYSALNDVREFDNGFKAYPADTLSNLGDFTLSFWMNGVGPVVGGAQGLFSISNKNEFWGNLDLFLENWDGGGADEAFLKVHMFNAGVASGNGEEWSEVKIPGALNKWTHIAVVYDSKTSSLNVYADGTAVIPNKVLGGGSYGKVKFNDFNGMVVGTYQFQTSPTLTNHGPESWAKSFNGAIDNLRLYNSALSASDIQALVTAQD
jgi:hypothetical protein